VTRRLYRDDAYLLEFDALVVARRLHQARPAVVLDQTAFYAESGGQPWDTGTLSGVPVVAVIEDGQDVLHVLAGPLQADRVHGVVDAQRRRDHREQHHGQHLLSRAFVERAGASTLSFHLGAEACSIDLDREVSEAQLAAAEALGVAAHEQAGDSVRLVEVEGFDVQPCCGTHPLKTSEVGVLLLLGAERYKGGSRIRFLCGHRALAAWRERTPVVQQLSALLSAPLEALPQAAQRLLDQAAEGVRRADALLARVIDGEAERLLAAGVVPILRAYDGWPPAELRLLAIRLTTLGSCVALLGSREGGKAHLAFAQSEGGGHDIPRLLQEAALRVGGRGGGRGNLAQGGGHQPAALDEALEAAAAAVRAAPVRP